MVKSTAAIRSPTVTLYWETLAQINGEHNENFANTTKSTRHYEEKTKGYSLRHNARFEDTLIQLGGQITGRL